MTIRRLIIGILFYAIILPCYSSVIYSVTDQNGNTVYSDTPIKNGKIIYLPEKNISPAPELSQSTPKAANSSPKKPVIKHNYTLFQITSPANNKTITEMRGFLVTLAIVPNLQSEDQVQLYIDRKPYGSPEKSTEILIGRLDEGNHTIAAKIVDKEKNVMAESDEIAFKVTLQMKSPQ